jgi:tRNA-dihydrouridine synthase
MLFIVALFRRASCRIAKQQYDEARIDLEYLLRIELSNTEAKVSMLCNNDVSSWKKRQDLLGI